MESAVLVYMFGLGVALGLFIMRIRADMMVHAERERCWLIADDFSKDAADGPDEWNKGYSDGCREVADHILEGK
jgi:hypothetical protein